MREVLLRSELRELYLSIIPRLLMPCAHSSSAPAFQYHHIPPKLSALRAEGLPGSASEDAAVSEQGLQLFAAGPGLLQARCATPWHRPTEVLADALFTFPGSRRFLPVRVARCVLVSLPQPFLPVSSPVSGLVFAEDAAAYGDCASRCDEGATGTGAAAISVAIPNEHLVTIAVDDSDRLTSVAPFRILAAFAHAVSIDEAVRTLVCGHEHAVAAFLAALRYVPLLAGRMEDYVRLAVLHAGCDLTRLVGLAPLRPLQGVSVPVSCAFSHSATAVLAFHAQRQHNRPNIEELLAASPIFFSGLITPKETVAVIGSVCGRCASPTALVMPFVVSLLFLRFNPDGFSSAYARDSCGVVMQTALAFSPSCFECDVLRAARFSIGVVPGLRDAVGALLGTVLRDGTLHATTDEPPPSASTLDKGRATSTSTSTSQCFLFDFPSQDAAASLRSTQSQSTAFAHHSQSQTQPRLSLASALHLGSLLSAGAFDVLPHISRPGAG